MEKSGKGLLDRSQQDKVSEQRGLPVEIVADSQFVVSVSGETVQLYYFSDGILTADAGQAAGTLVEGKLANGGVLNAIGDMIGTFRDHSLSFTSTALLQERAFPFLVAEAYQTASGNDKLLAITNGFSNGDYCVDYRYGTIYGKKASTGASLTATAYKVASQTASGGTVVTGNVDVVKAGGDTVAAANTARTTATKVLPVQHIDAAGNVLNIDAANTARTTGTKVLPTQPIDAAGNVLGRTAANTARTTGTLVDPVQHIGANGSPMPSGVAADPIYIKDTATGTDIVAVTATGAAAINTTTAVAAEWKLLQVTVHFSTAPTTSQNFVLTLDNTTGVAYDTVLYSINPSLSAATDLVFTPDSELKFRSGDEVVATFTNTDTRTYGLTIYYQLI